MCSPVGGRETGAVQFLVQHWSFKMFIMLDSQILRMSMRESNFENHLTKS